MRTARSNTQGFVRLGAGLVLNAILWTVISPGRAWDGHERQAWLDLFGASLGIAAIVITIPVFWRGQPWQAPIAFLLLWFPGFAIFTALAFIASN
jgi:hypothetical protein